ncbi:MAG: non-ribosomal peptide synthetase, partial [Acidobacteria bacterium]
MITSQDSASAATLVPTGDSAAEEIFVFPLSYAQRRMWFIDQLHPGNPAYKALHVLRLSGRLSVEAVRRSLQEIVRRHEILRTRFRVHDGEPMQEVLSIAAPPLQILDISGEGREQRAADLLEEEEKSGFDLEQGPLLRVKLVRLDAHEHLLLFAIHHIVTDGWSLGVLIQEVATLYAAYECGQESPLPELKVQYADYAVWQREWLQGEVLKKQLGYWR